ncbi:hypothetical protein SERLA73DRAFT_44873 [Serpula lacrymans var. lacrymans S7.3]|uniref:Uncharacterized protein n=1 Tax=Serpula lacrymans var. lacrymans (strain S7.3) TaxID=936435 RepID=F8PI20_SERL3|nr:hypothetical protein SERLA73DRAFT_44873 [Serpula lacrymans var. lacrymans S7.3]
MTNTLCSCHANPLVHHGQHFGQTIHALCNVQTLLMNRIVWLRELTHQNEKDLKFELVVSSPHWKTWIIHMFFTREQQEFHVF